MFGLKHTHACAIALFVGCLAATGLAQQQPVDGCGTELTPDAVRRSLGNVSDGAYRLTGEQQQWWQQRGVITIPVTIHDVRTDWGILGTPQAVIDQAFVDANAMWAPANIQFCQYGPTRPINSSLYFDLDPALENNLRQVDRVEDTINVYLVDEFGPWCGSGTFTSLQFQGIVMDRSCIGFGDRVTFAHELGHYFDLFHTHETAFGAECVDGSNCATAGDLVCDTPADPLLTGSVNFACAYTGTDVDPCNSDPYTPDPSNLMSYSRRQCMMIFSPQQIARAQATLTNLRPNLLNIDCNLDAPCGSGAGDCLADNGTPGCSDEACCALVCSIDPFCCESNWDQICANIAIAECGIAGDECFNAIGTTEGTVVPDLSDNQGSFDDTSCGTSDELDEWYAYTASCNGTATASICTELTSVDITLAVFDSCFGSEIACAEDHSDCFFGNDANAEVSWNAEAGQTYLIRVSGVGATQTMNFSGSMFISCEGCGNPDAGSCYVDTGSPHCDDPLCCETVCAIDPFCCNSMWDQICADLAATNCGNCGAPGAGGCFIANGTPYCDRAACCDAVCSIDSFCCDTAWDDLCAQQAITLGGSCIVIPTLEVPHVPIGSAVISTLPGGGIMIENFDNPEEGDGVRVDLENSASNQSIVFEDISYTGSLIGGAAVQVGVLDELNFDSPFIVDERLSMSSIVGIRTGVAVIAETNGAPAQARVFALNDDAIAAVGAFTHTLRGDGGIVATGDTAVLPSAVGGEHRGPEYAVWMEWEVAQSFTILSLPAVQADTIVVVTRNDDGPIDPNDAPPARSDGRSGPSDPTPLTSVYLLGADDLESLDSISVARERGDVPGPWCRADLDFSATVNVFDLLELLSAWGPCDGCAADLDDSGAVNVFDLLDLLASWGDCP